VTMEKGEKIIGYIENGIVIDHIPVGQVWKVAELLGVSYKRAGRISIGDGYESKKIGRKGIIKVEDINLGRKQLNLIALVAENATVSEILEGKIHKKFEIKIPEVLEGIVRCPNRGCISNDERQKVDSFIKYASKRGFSCNYCEREFGREELVLIID
jgi:aspartate carbamoyltransferase regulatory subunit